MKCGFLNLERLDRRHPKESVLQLEQLTTNTSRFPLNKMLRVARNISKVSSATRAISQHIAKATSSIAPNFISLRNNEKRVKMQPQKRDFADLALSSMVVSGGYALASTAVFGSAYFYWRYKVALPNEWIIKTGPFITDVHISRRTLLLPFQQSITVTMNPTTIKTIVNAMTTEKIPFNMPMAFTLCPIDNPEAMKKYSARLCGISKEAFDENLLGIIQGESRVLTAGMELEKLFSDRDAFKSHITDNINKSLEDFGLRIINVNVEELIDNDGSEYFKYMKKKALEKAVNKARVDVAEQTKEGIHSETYL